jgi:hypothetical protein
MQAPTVDVGVTKLRARAYLGAHTLLGLSIRATLYVGCHRYRAYPDQPAADEQDGTDGNGDDLQ